jgi:hypothetical protein
MWVSTRMYQLHLRSRTRDWAMTTSGIFETPCPYEVGAVVRFAGSLYRATAVGGDDLGVTVVKCVELTRATASRASSRASVAV